MVLFFHQFVPLSFWSDSLYEVLFAVLFNPAAVGVQPGDLVTANKLSENVSYFLSISTL